jgi:putative methyltransferase (TIGR04325 family)
VGRLINKFRNKSWYFKGSYETWDQALRLSTGYDDKAILERVLAAALKVKSGDAVFERDSVLFDEIQYSWPLLSGLMWCVARNMGKLSVLDFGGAMGSSYFQNRKFLVGIKNLHWNIVEQEHYVMAGKKYIQDDILKFYDNIDDCFRENSIDLAIFSGVLDLIGASYEVLENVIFRGVKTIIIDRSVFLDDVFDGGEDRFVLQVVPPNIFPAVLPYRLLSYKKIKAVLETAGYKIVETFPSVGGKGDYWEFRGLIAININFSEV